MSIICNFNVLIIYYVSYSSTYVYVHNTLIKSAQSSTVYLNVLLV